MLLAASNSNSDSMEICPMQQKVQRGRTSGLIDSVAQHYFQGSIPDAWVCCVQWAHWASHLEWDRLFQPVKAAR